MQGAIYQEVVNVLREVAPHDPNFNGVNIHALADHFARYPNTGAIVEDGQVTYVGENFDPKMLAASRAEDGDFGFTFVRGSLAKWREEL